MEPAAKPFRNTLMHYPDPRVDLIRVDLSRPLFGLVPVYFSSYDEATFAAAVDNFISKTSAATDEWAVS